MLSLKNNQKGFAAFFITILVLAVMFGIALSIAILTLGEQRISGNIVKSSQAYYTAEAGIEDALLRLAKVKQWSSPYNLSAGNGTAAIEISDIIGGSRIITSNGEVKNRERKIQIVYQITSEEVSFHYGAQAGRGGMVMEPNSKIMGNVFSNGTVVCPDPTGRAFITNNLIVARNGQKIERLEIGDPDPATPIDKAQAHTCVGCLIHGILYYVSEGGGSAGDCIVDEEIKVLPNEIEEENLPISDEQIQNWKNDASRNNDPACIYTGDYTIPGGVTESLGPLRIEGNLTLGNSAILIMVATIHVTGNITINPNAIIELDPDYESLSGLILADGKIIVENNAILRGSGQPESYIMLLSTDSSLDEANPAIYVKNSAEGAIFYTTQGIMRLRNNMKIREATGYKVYLDNNAEIEYESGLEKTNFSSGPGGTWTVVSWREIE
ncbi:pilus assembly PilX N-terminal domain-containing protein [Patescibacteria group bacterium]|nr:pilus assembly PilX N-terminal domain-containing protein [Patescibacteria group bacterium]